MQSINFLHLTDLHIGDKYQKGLISQTKKILFEDVEFILSKIESLDLVFFTGDFVQRGTSEEFDSLENFLKDLWERFNKKGHNPYLLCVPGNHDLERVNNENDPTHKVLLNWINDNQIRDSYFWDAPNQYHSFIIERFKNYQNWYNQTSIRKPSNISFGYLPGDFHCSLLINDVKLGIVGLNSTFLQLSGGDYRKKIGVYPKQIYKLFGDKYYEWLNEHHGSLLLTHHSHEWYEPKSESYFFNEIYTKDTFLENLCGHMHEPNFRSVSNNGYPPIRTILSPSLFGLEYYEDISKLERLHGYTAGRYNFETNKITKTIWPRISYQSKNGIKISQNEEFDLSKDTGSFTETLKELNIESTVDQQQEQLAQIENIELKGKNLFSKKNHEDIGLIRTYFKQNPSHNSVRLSEQNLSIKALTQKSFCWIVTNFGLGEDEFIGTILRDSGINSDNCFSINCDKLKTTEEIMEEIKNTHSKSLPYFLEILNSLDRPLIIFKYLTNEIINEPLKLKEFIRTITDFSPNVKIIFVSSEKPDISVFQYLELTSLDIPAVKHYIENSEEINSEFTFLEYEKIHRISSGIPFYIEKIIEQLKFRPLSDLGEMEYEKPSKEHTENFLPQELLNDIINLKKDKSKEGTRRFFLLTILSLLHGGETFTRIRRFDQNQPFHPDDITYLLRNKLIETIQVSSIFDEKKNDFESIKIIRSSRVVRDCVASLVSEEEKLDIYKETCSLYLGVNWRKSIKLIEPKEAELNLIVHQNLQIAIRFLLLKSIEKKDTLEIERISRLASTLVEYFSNKGSYKDAISLSEEILLLIGDVNFWDTEYTKTYLLKSLGENLRMTAIHNRSINVLTTICDDEKNSLSKTDRNDVRLSIAHAYKVLDNKDEAMKYANLVKSSESNKNSNLYLSAETILTNFIDDVDEKVRKLKSLKNKAEKFNFNTLKANIILEIGRTIQNEEQLKQIDKIISEPKTDTYTKVRAIVAKADIILNSKSINQITETDLYGLNIAYSYSFYQRLVALLSRCHKLAWNYWLSQNRFDQLLNIFRYSSFVWRICEKHELELFYIDQLHKNQSFIEWFDLNKVGINSVYYEQRIFDLYGNQKAIHE